VASLVDHDLEATVHGAVVRLAQRPAANGERSSPVRDLDQIRSFLTSNGPIAIVDLPWIPVFLVVCYLIYPWLGLIALGGALLMFAIAVQTERASHEPSRTMAQENGARLAMIETDRRNNETITAMGMLPSLTQRWSAVNQRYLGANERASDLVGSYGSISKVLRLLLQSAMLGTGAYLVIQGEMTAGAMIAASIMMGRAVAPIETAIANWRGFIAARESIARLSQALARLGGASELTPLPAPRHRLEVADVAVLPPNGQTPILTGLTFSLAAGDVMCVLGASGAGKTSLSRTLVGIWQPAAGTVRLDGAALDQWTPETLGPHIGFVSQAVELFDGTVAENIARMDRGVDSEAIIAAARAAGAHEMILRLPDGYNTPIGESGCALSGGQRQRIALARALFGTPFMVVLDEPNSNLDSAGENALHDAIRELKARGAIVVIIAHRRAALAVCDKLLVLADGGQQMFGPRDEVLHKISVAQASNARRAANLRVVSETVGAEA
jgi:ATP-binding cassette, subfamily C, type I secretion system permease/ATPase